MKCKIGNNIIPNAILKIDLTEQKSGELLVALSCPLAVYFDALEGELLLFLKLEECNFTINTILYKSLSSNDRGRSFSVCFVTSANDAIYLDSHLTPNYKLYK